MPAYLYKNSLRSLITKVSYEFSGKIVFVWPEPSRSLTVFTDLAWRNATAEVLQEPAIRARLYRVVDLFAMAAPHRWMSADGVHYSGLLARLKLNIILNMLCNE